MYKKKLAILGSTGSIGTQTLRVAEEHGDMFEVRVLTANNNVELLIEQARKFNPDAVVIANEDKYEQLRDALADTDVKVYAGSSALCDVVTMPSVDIVVSALVGFAGLLPTIEAIKASNGDVVTIEDCEILRAKKHLAHCGIYVEMTSAAALAGAEKFFQSGKPDNYRVVVPLTGNGLKR